MHAGPGRPDETLHGAWGHCDQGSADEQSDEGSASGRPETVGSSCSGGS